MQLFLLNSVRLLFGSGGFVGHETEISESEGAVAAFLMNHESIFQCANGAKERRVHSSNVESCLDEETVNRWTQQCGHSH